MREDEDVAEATGISTINYKLLAFAMGAAVGCLGGAVFATHLESVFPGTFNILVSITVLSIVILGGMGSIPGVVLGSLALIGLPELLREFAEFKLLVYGGVLVLMMILRPEGLLPDRARQLELHEADEEETGDDADSLAPASPGAEKPMPEGLQ
jgi:branched-chain amino acid transport system permease protein